MSRYSRAKLRAARLLVALVGLGFWLFIALLQGVGGAITEDGLRQPSTQQSAKRGGNDDNQDSL